MTIATLVGAGREIITVGPRTPVSEAVRRLAEKRIGAMPVLEDGTVVGIFSERDVLYALAEHGAVMLEWPVERVMTAPPITIAGTMPNLLIVHADTPWQTVADLVRAGRGASSKLSYASAGNGTSQHLCMELFKLQAGVEAVHVPYKGAGPALQAVMAGETLCSFENLAVAAPQLASGRIRALAITSARRLGAWPSVPTVAESGFPGFEVTSWQALFAPARLPAPLLARLNEAAVSALRLPGTRERFATLGMDVTPMTPQESQSFQRAEVEKWAKVIKAARLTIT